MNENGGILLESGTNEVEVLEFTLDGQGFGVNVLKVQAIEQFNPTNVTEIQLAHPAVIGTYHYREAVLGRTARRLMEGSVLVPEKYFKDG